VSLGQDVTRIADGRRAYEKAADLRASAHAWCVAHGSTRVR
jgi:hypothetical protein